MFVSHEILSRSDGSVVFSIWNRFYQTKLKELLRVITPPFKHPCFSSIALRNLTLCKFLMLRQKFTLTRNKQSKKFQNQLTPSDLACCALKKNCSLMIPENKLISSICLNHRHPLWSRYILFVLTFTDLMLQTFAILD